MCGIFGRWRCERRSKQPGTALCTSTVVAAESISVITRRLHEKARTTDIAAVLDRLQAQGPSMVIAWILPDVPGLYHDVLSLIRSSLNRSTHRWHTRGSVRCAHGYVALSLFVRLAHATQGWPEICVYESLVV